MKGKPGFRAGPKRRADPEEVALAVLNRLVGEPDRLGRFLSLTGLDPGSIRSIAGTPAFLAAVLDHVASDEALLLSIAAEAEIDPGSIEGARLALSPDPDWMP